MLSGSLAPFVYRLNIPHGTKLKNAIDICVMVSTSSLPTSQLHAEYQYGHPGGLKNCGSFRPEGTVCWGLFEYTFPINVVIETISEHMGTEPAKSLIPQKSTLKPEIIVETEPKNLIPEGSTSRATNMGSRVECSIGDLSYGTPSIAGRPRDEQTQEKGIEMSKPTVLTGDGEVRSPIPQVSPGSITASWKFCQFHANYFAKVVCWKVPDFMRTSGDHFDPKVFRLGLHNRAPDTLNTDGTEHFKIQVASALQLTGTTWNKFCEDVVIEDKSHWEAVYGHSPHAKSYSIDDIKCLLALDALFLVICMQITGGGLESLSKSLRRVMGTRIMRVHFHEFDHSDVYLVENQIPMVLLKRVVRILTEFCNFIAAWEDEKWQGRNIGYCVNWGYFNKPGITLEDRRTIFKKRMDGRMDRLKREPVEVGVHILDETYRILCGDHGPHVRDYQSVPLATYLKARRVRIQGKEFTCFEDISFEGGCLSIPYLCIYDSTERYLRNLVVHEELTYGSSKYCVRSYTTLMQNLMKTTEDVNLLVDLGVIHIAGTQYNVVDMWEKVGSRTRCPCLTEGFSLTLTRVNKHVGKRRNKLCYEFMKLYCSRPWLVVSVIVATCVTIATLFQAFVSIKKIL